MVLINEEGSQRTLLVPELHNSVSMSSCGDRHVVLDVRAGTKMELWRTDSDGSNPAKLAENVTGSSCSPDGKWVVYAAGSKLYVYPWKEALRWKLLMRAIPIRRFRRTENGSATDTWKVPWRWRKWRNPAEGGSPSHVLPLPTGADGLCWSPDQNGLQFLLTRKGATNVWEQQLKGGEPRQVTNFTSGRIFDFSWSRDGKQLYLAKGEHTSDVILISNFR